MKKYLSISLLLGLNMDMNIQLISTSLFTAVSVSLCVFLHTSGPQKPLGFSAAGIDPCQMVGTGTRCRRSQKGIPSTATLQLKFQTESLTNDTKLTQQHLPTMRIQRSTSTNFSRFFFHGTPAHC